MSSRPARGVIQGPGCMKTQDKWVATERTTVTGGVGRFVSNLGYAFRNEDAQIMKGGGDDPSHFNVSLFSSPVSHSTAYI